MIAPYMMFLTFVSAFGDFCSLLALLGATYKPINVHYCTSQSLKVYSHLVLGTSSVESINIVLVI